MLNFFLPFLLWCRQEMECEHAHFHFWFQFQPDGENFKPDVYFGNWVSSLCLPYPCCKREFFFFSFSLMSSVSHEQKHFMEPRVQRYRYLFFLVQQFQIHSLVVRKRLFDVPFIPCFTFKIELVSFTGMFFCTHVTFYAQSHFHKAFQIL